MKDGIFFLSVFFDIGRSQFQPLVDVRRVVGIQTEGAERNKQGEKAGPEFVVLKTQNAQSNENVVSGRDQHQGSAQGNGTHREPHRQA